MAVFLDELPEPFGEIERLVELAWRFERRTGAFLSIKPFALYELEQPSLLIEAIRREGVEL